MAHLWGNGCSLIIFDEVSHFLCKNMWIVLRWLFSLLYVKQNEQKIIILLLLRFFFLLEHTLSTPVGTPNLSMQVLIQPTYLTLGVDFCVYGPFLSHHKGNHTPACREILDKRQIEDYRRQK